MILNRFNKWGEAVNLRQSLDPDRHVDSLILHIWEYAEIHDVDVLYSVDPQSRLLRFKVTDGMGWALDYREVNSSNATPDLRDLLNTQAGRTTLIHCMSIPSSTWDTHE